MPIRHHQPPTDQFVAEFQKTIVPSAIPSSEFIDWEGIEEQIEAYEPQIEAILDLKDVSESEFVEGLTDALMHADDTRKWIDFYFELLGERGNKYSALEGVWKFYDIQRSIDAGDRQTAHDLAETLQEIGLQYLVDESADVRDHFRGMLVGMESHARKNRQGECFEDLVGDRIREIADRLNDAGYSVEMDDEYVTEYNDESGQQKTVDFALFEDGDLRLVVEANAYKVGGSKPSEIRRSYNHVAKRMRNDDIAFVWITDGQGWAKSLTNVLRQSYDDITDLYNLEQAETHLPEDVERFFETREV
ncbi:DpnII family type II restriction endonuclease [Halorussus amylolyticus]|uniref:DpnII family type II restriction endonuclease n=1 Tax=Halorussus amylolyticus TaxID=1126242 RepID=UPI00104358C8|nr:DpnII family type II restriction endonuclease [Halorussus amylolyticus]